MPDILVGCVYSVVFNSGDYHIMNFEAVGHRTAKVKGHLYGLLQAKTGMPIKLVGKWQQNKKYGQEFVFNTWEPWAIDADGVRSFLHLAVDGFADLRWVDALVAKYGIQTFETLTLKAREIQLETFENVSDETRDRGLLGWEKALAQRDLALLLKDGGLTASDVQMVMGRFGMGASQAIVSNPFRLMEIPGFAFAKADKLALHLGIDPKDPRRVQGAVLWALQEASKQGHLYLRRGELVAQVADLMQRELVYPLPLGDDPSKAYNDAVLELLKQKSVMLDLEAGLYLPDLHTYERKAAEILAGLIRAPVAGNDVSAFLDAYERAHRISLSAAQREAVESLSKHRVLVITGLPGTGKTTVLRAIVRQLEESKLSFALMAPTGIAAKRLSAVTGQPASTVHRALGYDGDSWGHHENNRYVIDAVVLDEASMMDQELFYRLLVSLRPDTRLVLVGDDAQLPSVGPGNVLRELIDCRHVPHVRLTEIFRQAVKGEIVENSHLINSGKLPKLTVQRAESEFRFVRLSDESRIVDLIVEMAIKLKARNANFQVLSPKYDGVVGVNNLNSRLRDALNPEGPKEWVRGAQHFRDGDRLMVVQNDYELGVYNGDVGKLRGIGRDSLFVDIHGISENQPSESVEFKHTLAETKLRLAYAITAHKSQGSEFDNIIMPIVKTQGRMLQRNLLYTAVTRARKRVWLIGEEAAVQKAVDNNKVVRRNTILSKAVGAYMVMSIDPQNSGESHGT